MESRGLRYGLHVKAGGSLALPLGARLWADQGDEGVNTDVDMKEVKSDVDVPTNAVNDVNGVHEARLKSERRGVRPLVTIVATPEESYQFSMIDGHEGPFDLYR